MNLATTYRYHDKGVSTFGGWNAFLFCWLVGLININIADIYIYIVAGFLTKSIILNNYSGGFWGVRPIFRVLKSSKNNITKC